ncbi:MAG: MBL fold metallo-hydrolase [Clostridia bacterium]|nr:MBL fold metallo-hydrolase [Clostridia bacterium]
MKKIKKYSVKSVIYIVSALFFISLLLHYAITVYLPSKNVRPDKADGGTLAELIFFYVGQGDAAAVLTDAGVMLIDTGPNSSERALAGSLKALGIDRIDLLFLSHTDEDHAGGCDEILRNFDVGSVYLPPEGHSGTVYDSLMTEARLHGVPVCDSAGGDGYLMGDVSVRVLSPYYPLPDDVNEASLILLLGIGNINCLFCGDAGVYAEELLLSRFLMYPENEKNADGGNPAVGENNISYNGSRGLLPRCDLMKIGHHGSSGSSSQKFIEAFAPRIAVISCGRGNSFGHPHATVTERLKAIGCEIFRTDLNGDLRFYTDGKSIYPEKNQ